METRYDSVYSKPISWSTIIIFSFFLIYWLNFFLFVCFFLLWELHLSALRDMLPYFASTGHRNYLQSSMVYLNSMLGLKNTLPEIYEAFMTGNHAPRQSDRLWTGLSTDLCKKTILMRDAWPCNERITTCTVDNVNGWLCFTSSSAQYSTHKDLGKSRLNRNYQDEKKDC